MEKVFSDQPEPVTRELIAYIEDMEISLVKKKYHITRTHFLEKYGRLSIYDIDLRKDIQLMTKALTF